MSMSLSRSTEAFALVTYVAFMCSLAGCISVLDDQADAGTSSGNGDGTSGDGDGDPGGESSDSGETGEPCGPFETTTVRGCPEIIGEGFCSEGGGHVDIGTPIV